jgi:hypothetical protein
MSPGSTPFPRLAHSRLGRVADRRDDVGG